jgi:hypothetical protein
MLSAGMPSAGRFITTRRSTGIAGAAIYDIVIFHTGVCNVEKVCSRPPNEPKFEYITMQPRTSHGRERNVNSPYETKVDHTNICGRNREPYHVERGCRRKIQFLAEIATMHR